MTRKLSCPKCLRMLAAYVNGTMRLRWKALLEVLEMARKKKAKKKH